MVAVPLPAGPSIPSLSRASRAAALRDLFGDGGRGFSPVLDDVVEQLWQSAVGARLAAAAPEVLTSPFATKLRAGFSTYLGLGLSAIVCSRKRPRVVRAACGTATWLRFEKDRIRRIGLLAMPALFLRACGREADRLAAAAALILVLDEILDDVWRDETPAARLSAMRTLILAGEGPDVPLVRAARSFALALGLLEPPPQRARAAEEMRARLVCWVEAEHALDLGTQDPVVCRAVGVAVSMELLAFATDAGRVGARELGWMQRIAELGQMVDDVLDLEKDARAGRATPAVRGQWDVNTVERALSSLRLETRSLVAEDGTRGAVLELYVETFDDELRRMTRILAENP